MPHYTPDEITRMIESSASPNLGRPDVGLLVATQAHAAATLYVGEVLESILVEIQYRNGTL